MTGGKEGENQAAARVAQEWRKELRWGMEWRRASQCKMRKKMLSRRDRERQVDNENSVLRIMVIVGSDRSDDSPSRFIKDWTDQKYFFSHFRMLFVVLTRESNSPPGRPFFHSYFRVRFFVSSLCLSLFSHSNLLELPPRQIKYLKKLEWRFKIKVNKRRGREWEMKNGRKLCFFSLMSPRNSIGLLVLPIFFSSLCYRMMTIRLIAKKFESREWRTWNGHDGCSSIENWFYSQQVKLTCWLIAAEWTVYLLCRSRGCIEYRKKILVQDIELYANAISIGSYACLFDDC